MAFEIRVVQTVRLACDNCGKTQKNWYDTHEEAIEAGCVEFVDASWKSPTKDVVHGLPVFVQHYARLCVKCAKTFRK